MAYKLYLTMENIYTLKANEREIKFAKLCKQKEQNIIIFYYKLKARQKMQLAMELG